MSAPGSPLQQGAALLGAGRFQEALQQFSLALRQQPAAIEPRIGLAQACAGAGDGCGTAAWLSDACRVAPQRPDLWLELARLLVAQRRETELPALLATAVAVNPQNAPLLQMQAELLLRERLYVQAVQPYRLLHAVQPQDPPTLLNYGYCLEQTGAIEEAVLRYREAVKHKPDFVEAHVNLAGVLWRREDFQGALAHAEKAVALAPTHPYAVRVLGSALLNLNRLEEAEVQLRRALELQPGFPLAEIDLAFVLLLAGRWAEGWTLYERRWRDTERTKRPNFWRPELEWKGPQLQPLKGKRIAVYAEQGFGDIVQFLRFVPLLQRDGATVFCVVPPELVSLVEASLPGVQCLTPQRQFEVDGHVALLELPMHFGVTLDALPTQAPYLRVAQDKTDAWRGKLYAWDDKLKIGIAWSGSPQQVNNANRAMRLSDLVPLMAIEGVQCFSLQKADAGPFMDVLPNREQMVDLTKDWNDFTDSAAMLQNLDLVITVDTAVAHLAGALGVPVWVMLPPNADWRWLLEREDSPWYPTMRLFRRGFGEARARQVGRVVEAVRGRLAAR